MRRVAALLGLLLLFVVVGADAQTPLFTVDTVNVTAFGKKYAIATFRDGGQRMIPAEGWRLKEILDHFGATLSFDSGTGILSVTRGGHASSWKVGEKRVIAHDAGGNDVQGEMVLQDGKPWIPILGLATLLPCRVNGDPDMEIDPLITDIRLAPDRSEFALHVESSAPVAMKTMVLQAPHRFVVDIPGAALDLEHFGTIRSIAHPDLGIIRFGQFSFAPNVVRIVIPLQGELEVEPLPQSTETHLIMALRRGDVRTVGQNFSVQKITRVGLVKGAGGATVDLKVTGPVQMAWHRLRPPDNRIFVDVPGAVLTTPRQTLEVGDGWTGNVTVSQFQVTPSPVVRIVFNMARPAAFDIKTTGPSHDDVRLSVRNDTVRMTDDTLSGVKINALPSKGATVVIDPGHGGSDTGAINPKTGLYEKTVTLDIAKRLAAMLKKAGYNVFLTRDRDRDVSYAGSSNTEELAARCKIANDVHADLFVSIHCNASANRSAFGSSAHWFKSCDLPLARTVLASLVRESGCTSRGCHYNRFFVLRHCSMPSVLVETAFITNTREGRLLGSDDYRNKQARSIFDGLKGYMARYGNAYRRSAMRR